MTIPLPRALVAMCLAASAMACLFPASTVGQSACGPSLRLDAHKDVGRGRAPLIIGDSVISPPAQKLAAMGYRVDSQDCRGFQQAFEVLKGEGANGKLGHFVVLAVGADYPLTLSRIRDALKVLGSKHGQKRVLGLVTSREPAASHDVDVVRRAGEKYKHRVKVLDWVQKSSGHPEWFVSGDWHLTSSGAAAYAELMKKGLKYASWHHRD